MLYADIADYYPFMYDIVVSAFTYLGTRMQELGIHVIIRVAIIAIIPSLYSSHDLWSYLQKLLISHSTAV